MTQTPQQPPRDLPEPLDTVERELARALGNLPSAQPPPELDARILGEARRAVHAAQPRGGRRRWFLGFGTAASALLAVGIFVKTYLPGQDGFFVPTPTQHQAATPEAEAPRGATMDRAEAKQLGQPAPAGGAALPATVEPPPPPAPPQTVATEDVQPAPAMITPVESPAPTPLAMPAPPPPPVVADEAMQASNAAVAFPASSTAAGKPAATTSDAPARAAAVAEPEGAFRAAPPPAPAPAPVAPAQGAAREDYDARSNAGSRDQTAQKAIQLDTLQKDAAPAAKTAPLSPADASASGIVGAEPVNEDKKLDQVDGGGVGDKRKRMQEGGLPGVADDASLPPEQWIERIHARLRASDRSGARTSLRQYHQRYPDEPIPDDLQSLLQ